MHFHRVHVFLTHLRISTSHESAFSQPREFPDIFQSHCDAAAEADLAALGLAFTVQFADLPLDWDETDLEYAHRVDLFLLLVLFKTPISPFFPVRYNLKDSYYYHQDAMYYSNFIKNMWFFPALDESSKPFLTRDVTLIAPYFIVIFFRLRCQDHLNKQTKFGRTLWFHIFIEPSSLRSMLVSGRW